jgi:hypothetical protein
MPQGKFLATIRNANDGFMKFIGSLTTCPVLWDIVTKQQCQQVSQICLLWKSAENISLCEKK